MLTLCSIQLHIICLASSFVRLLHWKMFNPDFFISSFKIFSDAASVEYRGSLSTVIFGAVLLGDGDEGLSYYAVAVARRNNPSVNFYTLKGKVACFPGEF